MKTTLHACNAIEGLVMGYAYGQAISASDRQRVEKHLAGCTDCAETVGFLRASLKTARTHPEPAGPGEPHPDSALIVALEADTLDAPTSEHVSAHIVHDGALLPAVAGEIALRVPIDIELAHHSPPRNGRFPD